MLGITCEEEKAEVLNVLMGPLISKGGLRGRGDVPALITVSTVREVVGVSLVSCINV